MSGSTSMASTAPSISPRQYASYAYLSPSMMFLLITDTLSSSVCSPIKWMSYPVYFADSRENKEIAIPTFKPSSQLIRALKPFHVNPLRDCLSHLFPQETLDDMQRHMEARC